MKGIKTYAISFFFLQLLYSVSGHGNTDKNLQPHTSGPRIVGGRDASPGELSFQVTIHWKYVGGRGSRHWCGGSIIDSEHVLTAAHCVSGLSPEELVVFAGVLNKTAESSEETKVVRQVKEIFLHEGFVFKPVNNDIAILKVSSAFPTDNNPSVKEIPLRKDDATDGVKCTVSGWGRLREEEKTTPQILQVAVVHLITNDKCRDMYRKGNDGSIEPGMICAAKLHGGTDACTEDSGGPLVCGGLLTGIVSWGFGCALPDYPGVYTDVAYYKEWIDRQIHKYKEEL